MKAIKLLCLVLALVVVVFAFAACEDKKEPEAQEQVVEEVVETVEETENDIIDGMPNPIVEYDSVEAAVIQVGHLCPLPTIYERYNKKVQVISNSLIEIIYTDDQGEVLRIREEARPSGDISGVYTEFAYTNTIQVGGNDVTINGDSEDSITLVTWNDGAYSHSINYAEGHSQEEVSAVVAEINA